jgi:methyl farnesoate epoxidase/farnesoate epoxidase
VDGPVWREQRRFTLRHLRDFGFGKRSMEAFIHDEAHALIKLVDLRISDEDFDLLPFLSILAINVLWTIMAGKRHDFDDENFLKLTHSVMAMFRLGSQFNPVIFSPTLQNIPIVNSSFKIQTTTTLQIRRFVQVLLLFCFTHN